MLNSFQISNFRLFQSLKVERLNRVNLIVGKNNSGKSTFLEAIELYISNASPSVILDLINFRQENWSNAAQPRSQSSIGNPLRHLFFGHQFPQIGQQGILLGELSSSTKLHIGLAAYSYKQNEDEGSIRVKKISASDLDYFNEDDEDMKIVLVAEEHGKTRRLFILDVDIIDARRLSYRNLYEHDFKSTWQIVSTDNMPNENLAALWDLTSLTNMEIEVISALK